MDENLKVDMDIWSWAVVLGILVALLLGSYSALNVYQHDEAGQASIVRYYEDGSGRIKLSNGYCMFPAFDSPEDKVVCVKEGE